MLRSYRREWGYVHRQCLLRWRWWCRWRWWWWYLLSFFSLRAIIETRRDFGATRRKKKLVAPFKESKKNVVVCVNNRKSNWADGRKNGPGLTHGASGNCLESSIFGGRKRFFFAKVINKWLFGPLSFGLFVLKTNSAMPMVSLSIVGDWLEFKRSISLSVVRWRTSVNVNLVLWHKWLICWLLWNSLEFLGILGVLGI